MLFKLTADGSRVQEYVNGTLEIDEVKHLEINPEVSSSVDGVSVDGVCMSRLLCLLS